MPGPSRQLNRWRCLCGEKPTGIRLAAEISWPRQLQDCAFNLVFPDARAQTSNTPRALCFLSRDEADSLVAMKVKTDYIGLKKKLLIRAYRK